MLSLFELETVQQVNHRIQQLSPNHQAQWGKMTVAQMCAHCAGAMQMATGDIELPRVFIGYIIAPFFKSSYYNDKPFPKGLNTDKALVINTSKTFESERSNLLFWINNFHQGGSQQCTTAAHPLLGFFTPEQWAMGMYKHLDHHLRQFGV